MKKFILSSITLASILVIGMTLSSNASGPGGNRTGSPGSSGTCGSCHGGGNFSGQLKVGVVEIGDTNFITTYTPSKDYEIWVKIKGTSTRMGFQATAINASGTAAGTYGTAPSGTSTYTSSSKVIWGHNSPSSTGDWRIKWTAPASGTGNVTFYSSCVLANGNNNDNGDQVVQGSKTITEAVASNVKINKQQIQLLGNPIQNNVVLSESVKMMVIWNLEGKVVAKTNNSNTCNISTLAHGNYILQILTNDHQYQSFNIVKD